jgi:hypothetical protein
MNDFTLTNIQIPFNNPLPNLPPGGKEWPSLSPLGETGKGVNGEKQISAWYKNLFIDFTLTNIQIPFNVYGKNTLITFPEYISLIKQEIFLFRISNLIRN